ncbi:mariner Mos1 transposase [Trichonephila clavipes]|nr:mariner Mos1 transposase [Trichonephila clavipes]
MVSPKFVTSAEISTGKFCRYADWGIQIGKCDSCNACKTNCQHRLLFCRFLNHYLRLSQNHLPVVLHDNARCHVVNNVTLPLRRWQWEILEDPYYSPDISSCDFGLFPKLKEPLRGR